MSSSRSRCSPCRFLLFATLALLVLSSPTVAHAGGPDDWELHVNPYPGPLGGACGAPVEARGWSFPPTSEVAIGLLDEDGAFTELARITTSENGFLLFDLPDPYPPDCAPGLTLTFAARVVTSEGYLGDAAGPYQAVSVLETQPKPTAFLEFAGGLPGDCSSILISGYGFPPLADVVLMIGAADPLVHDFAPVAYPTTNAEGMFSIHTDYFSILRCQEGDQFGLYAYLTGSAGEIDPGFVRVSAIYTVGSPAPGAAGTANLRRDSPPSRSLQLLLLAATALLVTVGRATAPRREGPRL